MRVTLSNIIRAAARCFIIPLAIALLTHAAGAGSPGASFEEQSAAVAAIDSAPLCDAGLTSKFGANESAIEEFCVNLGGRAAPRMAAGCDAPPQCQQRQAEPGCSWQTCNIRRSPEGCVIWDCCKSCNN